MRGLKVEASILRVNANTQGFRVNGDARIGNAAVAVDYRKRPDADAEARAQTVLDEAARNYLGFELGGALSGPVPIKFNGRIASDGDSRFAVDADLTQAKVDDLLPGWSKPAGKGARDLHPDREAAVAPHRRPRDRRLGRAGQGRDRDRRLRRRASAKFPVFALSDGDKANVKAERGTDGTLRVTMRGDVYDGRGFVKSAMAGRADPNAKRAPRTSISTSRSAPWSATTARRCAASSCGCRAAPAHPRFALNAKIGRDTPLVGDLRGRATPAARSFSSRANDAGALFRFTDIYSRIIGGEMWVALDPPTADKAPQEGMLNIRDFSVRGEAALDRVAACRPAIAAASIISRACGSSSPARRPLSIREGTCAARPSAPPSTARSTTCATTCACAAPSCRSTRSTTCSARSRCSAMFLGGSNEGLLGVTYEVVGPPNAPVLRVNPMSAVAPGFLRKFFEFRDRHRRRATGAEYAAPIQNSPIRRAVNTGFSSTCFFLPSESLITPSA